MHLNMLIDDNIFFCFRVTYRDAVAEAGTGPALLAIKDMIESGKVNGEEAAQLLAVLSNSAQFPTAEYLSTLFVCIETFNM